MKPAYAPDIYLTSPDNSIRFALGQSGAQPLVVFGLNPSTADDTRPDQTIKKVMGFAEKNGFDGFLMLNLYPLRRTIPDDLPPEVDPKVAAANLKHISTLLKQHPSPSLLAAWGDIFEIRPYFRILLSEIYNHLPFSKWMQIGSLTKKGHPRHPSRAAYTLGFEPFEIDSYQILL